MLPDNGSATPRVSDQRPLISVIDLEVVYFVADAADRHSGRRKELPGHIVLLAYCQYLRLTVHWHGVCVTVFFDAFGSDF